MTKTLGQSIPYAITATGCWPFVRSGGDPYYWQAIHTKSQGRPTLPENKTGYNWRMRSRWAHAEVAAFPGTRGHASVTDRIAATIQAMIAGQFDPALWEPIVPMHDRGMTGYSHSSPKPPGGPLYGYGSAWYWYDRQTQQPTGHNRTPGYTITGEGDTGTTTHRAWLAQMYATDCDTAPGLTRPIAIVGGLAIGITSTEQPAWTQWPLNLDISTHDSTAWKNSLFNPDYNDRPRRVAPVNRYPSSDGPPYSRTITLPITIDPLNALKIAGPCPAWAKAVTVSITNVDGLVEYIGPQQTLTKAWDINLTAYRLRAVEAP